MSNPNDKLKSSFAPPKTFKDVKMNIPPGSDHAEVMVMCCLPIQEAADYLRHLATQLEAGAAKVAQVRGLSEKPAN
jgi:hypothetical protein